MPAVFYTIQGDAGEDLNHPNCFNVPTKGRVTLEVVQQHFPLRAEGTFHFRFRHAGKGGAFSWVDVSASADLPLFHNLIFMKVLRTSASGAAAQRHLLRFILSRLLMLACCTFLRLPNRCAEVRDRPAARRGGLPVAALRKRSWRSCIGAHVDPHI